MLTQFAKVGQTNHLIVKCSLICIGHQQSHIHRGGLLNTSSPPTSNSFPKLCQTRHLVVKCSLTYIGGLLNCFLSNHQSFCKLLSDKRCCSAMLSQFAKFCQTNHLVVKCSQFEIFCQTNHLVVECSLTYIGEGC